MCVQWPTERAPQDWIAEFRWWYYDPIDFSKDITGNPCALGCVAGSRAADAADAVAVAVLVGIRTVVVESSEGVPLAPMTRWPPPHFTLCTATHTHTHTFRVHSHSAAHSHTHTQFSALIADGIAEGALCECVVTFACATQFRTHNRHTNTQSHIHAHRHISIHTHTHTDTLTPASVPI